MKTGNLFKLIESKIIIGLNKNQFRISNGI